MNRCPPEVWMKICGLTCTDDGTSGRSLSLVSRFFNEVSRPFKYQSLALPRSKHVIKLNIVLSQLPQDHRRVKYLFIHCPHVFLDDAEQASDDDYGSDMGSEGSLGETEEETDEDDSASSPSLQASLRQELNELRDEARQFPFTDDSPMEVDTQPSEFSKQLNSADNIVADALFSLLKKVAPSLTILSLFWVSCQGRLIEELIPPLPSLRELCLLRRFVGEDEIEPETDDRALPLFPALRRLHLGGYLEQRPTQLGETISDMAPALLLLKIPRWEFHSADEPPVVFPSSIEHIYIESDRQITGYSEDSIPSGHGQPMGAAAPNERLGPYLSRFPEPHARPLGVTSSSVDLYDPVIWKNHWHSRVEGGCGCWQHHEA